MRTKWLAAILVVSLFVGNVVEVASAADLVNAPETASPLIQIMSITPSVSSPQPVGTTVTWTAQATGGGPLEYQFSVRHGQTAPTVVQDFGSSSTFTYTYIQEEAYVVVVAVQLASTPGQSVSLASAPFRLTSRVVNHTPLVTPVANPLVALYSGPGCASGTVVVQFFPAGQPTNIDSTPAQLCNNRSVNVYVAGMRANTQYNIQQIVTNGTHVTKGPIVSFTTGQPTIGFSTYTEPTPTDANTSTTDDVLFVDSTGTTTPYSNATDLNGNIIWYYDPAQYPNFGPADEYVSHPVSGGSVLVLLGDSMTNTMTLREVDLAGNLVRQTTVGRVNEQLAALGKAQIDSFHHEVVRFPNGHTLTLGYIEKLFPPGTQGHPGPDPVDILTDQIVDLDQNFQVAWTWNAFDWLDVNRPAVLGETCANGQLGCPIPGLKLAAVANDWTHSNAVVFSPADNDILFSMRHQDWIIKIDYNNATGTGEVIWRLGQDGDFTIDDPSNNAYPWFSHQHGIANDIGPSLDRLDTFDNGNTRCLTAPQPCDSRGQVYLLDEVNKVATLSINADTGGNSGALGWAQTLSNGNYSFTSGFQVTGGSGAFGQAIEVQPTSIDGTINFVFQSSPALLYRVYRMTSMYSD